MRQILRTNLRFLKQLCCCFLLLLATHAAQAQVKLLFDNAVYNGDTVTVDVVAYNFVDIAAMQYTTQYEPDLLEFIEAINLQLPGLNSFSFAVAQADSGKLGLSWIDSALSGVTVEDGSAIYSLKFLQKSEFSGTLNINGSGIAVEIVNINDELLTLNTCEFSFRPANVTGYVFHDTNDDCAEDPDEIRLAGWTVIAENRVTGNVRYVTTNSEGNYGIFLNPENDYLLKVIPPAAVWSACSPEGVVLTLPEGATEAARLEFGVRSEVDCPLMEVSVSTPFVRRCFENDYTVAFSNQGTATAEDAYVEVTLDEAFTFISSTLDATLVAETDNTYRFELGDVDVNRSGRFKIRVLVGCDGVALGQSHCVMAHVYPDDPCEVDPLWSGADITVKGECTEEDEVRFTITNVGDGSMDEMGRFIVSQDMILLREADFQLESGQSRVVSLAGDGKTYRLDAEQAFANPKAGVTGVVVEGCGRDAEGDFSRGFANLFAQSDSDPFISIDCQENIGAYDPNDKTPYPRGYGEKRFIENDVALEYKIRFQNTGTDTAFNVIILDTLSATLDPKTVRPGASSHPYDFEINDEGVLSFMFDNIMLPDSNINEPASHGFVIFKIEQTADNVDGTEIYNDAAIYFDFNEPVITNETKHTIGREFVEVVNNVNTTDFPTATVAIYPNPFTERATFTVAGVNDQEITLRIYNAQGQLLRQQISRDLTFDFYKKGLTSGLYFFEMLIDHKVLNQGKLMLK